MKESEGFQFWTQKRVLDDASCWFARFGGQKNTNPFHCSTGRRRRRSTSLQHIRRVHDVRERRVEWK